MAKYTPKTIYELKYLVEDANIYLGDIDTSNITDMFQLFEKVERYDFSGIDSWDTSKVVNMASMFFSAKFFNESINSWNTSNVVSMDSMFCTAEKFNKPLDNWDTSNVVDMAYMFEDAKSFNQNINLWDVSSVRDNQGMFWGSGVSKLPKWYKKRNVSNRKALTEANKKYVKEAIANPRSKKPKIAPQDKPKSNTNDWSKLFGGSSKPTSTNKSAFMLIGVTLFFVFLAYVAINFDDIRYSITNNNNAKSQPTQTQTTKPKQMQPAKSAQPAQNVLRCDNKDLLKHIIESYKNDLWINRHNSYPDELAYWQELYQKHGINLTNAEELANSLKYNIVNVDTKSSDEVNKQVDCEVEIEVVFPMPQSNPFKIYNAIDYNARIANDNGIEFGILNMRSVDK